MKITRNDVNTRDHPCFELTDPGVRGVRFRAAYGECGFQWGRRLVCTGDLRWRVPPGLGPAAPTVWLPLFGYNRVATDRWWA